MTLHTLLFISNEILRKWCNWYHTKHSKRVKAKHMTYKASCDTRAQWQSTLLMSAWSLRHCTHDWCIFCLYTFVSNFHFISISFPFPAFPCALWNWFWNHFDKIGGPRIRCLWGTGLLGDFPGLSPPNLSETLDVFLYRLSFWMCMARNLSLIMYAVCA